MGILDLIFPKRCVSCKRVGDYVCSNCFSFLAFNDNSICLICNKSSINGLTHLNCRGKYRIDGSFSSIVYSGVAKRLIFRFKYKPFLLDLQSLLTELFYEGLIQNETLARDLKHAILVPIPLHSSKMRKRGYNQAEILAKGLSERLKIPFEDVLLRKRNTKSQFRLGQQERKDNIKGAFEVKIDVKRKTIFLVDDILTSGSTLAEAANVLKHKGAAKVFGITLAREQ